MAEACDLCGGRELEAVYEPASRRGLKVHVCKTCGLLQSLPRKDRAPREGASVSAGADWGNLRYGKGFRVGPHIEMLKACAWPHRAPKILDVGANRGAFIDAALTLWSDASIVAVEPDERVTTGYAKRANVALLPHRIEDCAFAEASFDIIYSSHTLEHLASARRVLEQHARVLKPKGLLLLEVPNNAMLASPDIVEEWFIDKHLYHYSKTTLCALLAAAGFDVVEPPSDGDLAYLTLLARPSTRPRATPVDQSECDRSRKLVSAYTVNRERNHKALRSVAHWITTRSGRVAVWGAGRLFDALVREGGLDPARLAGVIDDGLKAQLSGRHGVPLRGSDELADIQPDFLVIASRSFADEIKTKAKTLVPRAEIASFTDLLEHAVAHTETTMRQTA